MPQTTAPARSSLLAIPFTAPTGDAAAEKLADSTFAQVYGRVSISHPGQVGLTKEPLPSRDLRAALDRGRANHSTYILCGTVEREGTTQVLTVEDRHRRREVRSYGRSHIRRLAPTRRKSPTEVDSKVPSLGEE